MRIKSILIILMFSNITVLFGQQAIAVPLEFEGELKYQRYDQEDEWSNIQINMPMYEGDKLYIEKEASIKLIYEAGVTESFEGETLIVIERIDSIKGSLLISDVWNKLIGKFQLVYSEKKLTAYPGIRGDFSEGMPGSIISPKNTKIDNLNLTFLWTNDNDIVEFEFILLNNKEKIFQQKLKDAEFTFSEPSEILEPGERYMWFIISYFPMGVQIVDSAFFSVASEKEIAEINSKLRQLDSELCKDKHCSFSDLAKAILLEETGFKIGARFFYRKYMEELDYAVPAVLLYVDFLERNGYHELAQKELTKINEIPEELKGKW